MATQVQGLGVTVLRLESILPAFYTPPFGMPLYWGDERSGALPAAVRAYNEACLGQGALTERQLRLLCGYCRYFIHAPCWEANCLECDCPEHLATLNELRQRSKTLASLESIRRWNEEAVELGLDPF